VADDSIGETAKAMNLTWQPLPFATGETAMFGTIKLGIIRHRGNVWSAYVGNKKLKASKSKREAIKLILEEVSIQGRLF
jgi:hypothetical protein